MTAYLYRCFDDTGRLIYVGSTRNLAQRLDLHRDRSWWAQQVRRVVARVLPTSSAAHAAEIEAIRAERPRWNVASRWASRRLWDAQDWADYHHSLQRLQDRWPTIARGRWITGVEREYFRTFGSRLP